MSFQHIRLLLPFTLPTLLACLPLRYLLLHSASSLFITIFNYVIFRISHALDCYAITPGLHAAWFLHYRLCLAAKASLSATHAISRHYQYYHATPRHIISSIFNTVVMASPEYFADYWFFIRHWLLISRHQLHCSRRLVASNSSLRHCHYHAIHATPSSSRHRHRYSAGRSTFDCHMPSSPFVYWSASRLRQATPSLSLDGATPPRALPLVGQYAE